MIRLVKPANYSGAMQQVSIFQATDNYPVFVFQPTTKDVAPFQSQNVTSKWNDKFVTPLNLVGENQKVLATKTTPVEIIEGVVNNAKIENLSLWVESETTIDGKKVKQTIFNDKIKYSCKAGVLTCLGEI